MTDISSSTSADKIGTALVSNLGLLRQTILSQSNIPVPSLQVCLSHVQGLIEPGLASGYNPKKQGKRKTKEKILEEKNNIETALLSKPEEYTHLSIQSKILLREHANIMSGILLYAKYLHEFETIKDDAMVKKYQRLYVNAKNVLRHKLGDEVFAGWMHNLMQASGHNNHKQFGVIFYADSYCEPEFQHIADIANTLNLTNLAKLPEMPKKIKIPTNLFGTDREYVTQSLKSGLGHILLPSDPKQDNTVYLVCPGLEKLAQYPEKIVAQIKSGGGLAVFNQIQKEIAALNLPPKWKANIKVVGDDMGSRIAEGYFAEIQKGLVHQLGSVSEITKWAAFKKVERLNLETVQHSPLLSSKFRGEHPKFDKFLSDFKIPQSLGKAGLVLNLAKELGVGKGINAVDEHLQQHHKYRMVRPGLKFLTGNVTPVASGFLSGAAIGSAIPGIGTGVGALVGGGIAIARMIFKGFSLWKKRKKEKLKKVSEEQGLEMRSSYEELGAVPRHFTSRESLFLSGKVNKPSRERKLHRLEEHEVHHRPPRKPPRPENS